tara:strand:+ start:37 stop:225 length:189 start_codon:yes stop_codon:yes gene_type:complete
MENYVHVLYVENFKIVKHEFKKIKKQNIEPHCYIDKHGKKICYDVNYYCNETKTISKKECKI